MKFTILNPKFEKCAEGIAYKFEIRVNLNEKMGLYISQIDFINAFGNVFTWKNTEKTKKTFLNGGNKVYKGIVPVDKALMQNSRIRLHIIDTEGLVKYVVPYFYVDSKTWSKDKVSTKSVSLGDVEFLIEETKELKEENPKEVSVLEEPEKKAEPELSDEVIEKNTLPSLKKYVNAIFREMYYIREAGGRKYRITDGQLMFKAEKVYFYTFDMESELFVAEDSPVSIILPGDKKIEGEVYITSGLQITIVLEEDIGDFISKADMMVEPWKLLKALAKTLSEINYEENSIAMKLYEEGPKLAYDSPLDKIVCGQEKAIEHVGREDITVVWGPPGTGKTYTMAKMASEYIEQDKSILIVSHSNISVDVVTHKIVKNLRENGKEEYLESGRVLRYGYVRDIDLANEEYATAYNFVLKHHPHLKERMDSIEAELVKKKKLYGEKSKQVFECEKERKAITADIKQLQKTYVNGAHIVTTTVSKLIVDPILVKRKFDIVIFDEASMAYIGQILASASHAKKRFVCIGDFNQLAPIAQSEVKEMLQTDIFQHLNIISTTGKLQNHPWLVMLDVQRRMHPSIVDFSNRKIYHNLISTGEKVVDNVRKTLMAEPFAGSPLVYINTMGTYAIAAANDNHSKYNILSAGIAVYTALQYAKQNISVGIIAPYAAQVRLIKAMLADDGSETAMKIQCATIHQYQGSENDVIIFDTVENFPYTKPGLLFRDNANRNVLRLINVAITRAKSKFIMIGNKWFWENQMQIPNNMAKKLTEYMTENAQMIRHKGESLENFLFQNDESIIFYGEKKSYEERLKKDIQKARKKIVISVPEMEMKEYESVLQFILESAKRGVDVVVKVLHKEELNKKLVPMAQVTNNAVFPMLIIDEKILWYGVPNGTGIIGKTQAQVKTVCQLQYRFAGERVCEIIDVFADVGVIVEEGIIKGAFKNIISLSGSTETFQDYVNMFKKCPDCHLPYTVSVSPLKKIFYKCKKCSKTDLISPETIRSYLDRNSIACKNCKGEIKVGLGKKGLYLKCKEEFNKFFELSELL